MKLYTKPGACSTAVHIALQWAGGPFEVEILDGPSMKAPAYLAINPAGAVPALVDGDFVLTQNAAIMGYIADTHPQAGLGGDGSARERADATRWLAFVNSDVHPAFKPIFSPARYVGDESQHDAVKAAARNLVRGLMESADKRLADNSWLAGFRSFADPYFYMTVRWAQGTGVDMAGLDNIAAFKVRMDADQGVQATLKAEGLA
ncbi:MULTISPECIES: glutathione S-transferase N-terminal domain-containing protein [unclassified Luteimonas]|uniref:glutathione S-transferase family protein n=1 Tax=unclassified Luteimonas TaxID=2629088 RepID=UPI0018F09488|nr:MULTISPECIES: glutathione S-transferase N-terminal domain-containing protein [unclassified Luteimonas]MBJ6981169.1 glutathione S-transferase N-terminal domain-containing protein [Luteimonas sp. MC1572]MBJ7576251.1 glutathione S-transferase N-terminal domain-containing protein [Luteimonas sp. MC1828]QQO02499.1 glutathione S-transferase N-terminal domain-containing protein [Luteimonas sp. MC1572]